MNKYLPSVVKRCLNSAEEMIPLPSLSKCRKPSMKSSAVSDVRALLIA